jgi:hypothetical protein
MVDADGYAAGEVLNPSWQTRPTEALWAEAELGRALRGQAALPSRRYRTPCAGDRAGHYGARDR